MIAAMITCVVLVTATILILYETLRFTSNHLAELPIPPRAHIIVVVLAAFVGHTLAVWTYALAYWLTADALGGFGGLPVDDFMDYLYFSAITYTSLGFGDHYPLSHLRLIAGVEALNGLLLIGWSASFTYLAMERYWPMHTARHSQRRWGMMHRTAPHSRKEPETVKVEKSSQADKAGVPEKRR